MFGDTDINSLFATLVGASVAVIMVATASKHFRRTSGKEGLPLPPGPPRQWFWDNLMPRVNICLAINEWANEYGPVITVPQGSENIIVIARVDAATDIMEKEGSALADRPPMIAADELMSQHNRITLTRSGERFRRLRKAVHAHLQVKVVETYRDTQMDQARTLLFDIMADGRGFQKYVHRYTTSVILRTTYGKAKSVSFDDPDFTGVRTAIAHFIEGMRPGAYLVDRLPWLKYVPGYGRRLRGFYKDDLKFYRAMLARVRQEMVSDNARPSIMRTLLENVEEHRLSEDEMAFLSGTLYEAGSDTTAQAIITMVMAAAYFPDEQRRVQEELDAVVGRDRLPNWNDRDHLPQLQAFMSETLRWRPISPLGFGHRTTRDVIWKGYRIPAGTTVIGNHWAISRDPELFPDPETFDVRRWLDENDQYRTDVGCFAFGFGRRVCPGMHLANQSLYVTFAFMLWAFRIQQQPDNPINPTTDNDNIVSHHAPFDVDFVPRVDGARLKEMLMAL